MDKKRYYNHCHFLTNHAMLMFFQIWKTKNRNHPLYVIKKDKKILYFGHFRQTHKQTDMATRTYQPTILLHHRSPSCGAFSNLSQHQCFCSNLLSIMSYHSRPKQCNSKNQSAQIFKILSRQKDFKQLDGLFCCWCCTLYIALAKL